MGYSKAIALAAVLGTGLFSSGLALAADMPVPYVEPVPVVASGWYLRGDIGYKLYNDPDISFNTSTYTDSWNNTSLDGTAVLGLGVGYQFTDYLRADVTADYEFKSGAYGEGYCGGCGGVGHTVETADIDAWTILANAYVDVGTWGGLTPYIGGGVGTAYVQTSNIAYLNPNGVSGTWDGNGQWNFAWALMAGASYAVTPNTSIDFNYRYLNLGDAQSGFINAGGGGTINYDNISANEFRVGLRYKFY